MVDSMIEQWSDLMPGTTLRLNCGCEGIVTVVSDSHVTIEKFKPHGFSKFPEGMVSPETFTRFAYRIYFHAAEVL